MSSEQFQSAHDNIYNTGTRLLQYIQEIRAGRLGEGDKTQGLQSVENDITKALNALKDQKYQVAVIAAMKAGKSTFLNVLIGADILASESEACTVCRTDIRPIAPGATPRLLEYREGQRQPIAIASGEAGEIRQKFLDRTHEIRATQNCDRTTRFELEHPIEAINKLPSLAGFTLVDTPGPNEWESADFSTIELKRTALEALRTCDAILFVLDYSSFKDNTNSELLQQLLEQRQEALKENTGKLYFILNKVDRKAEGDRSINDVITDLKQALINFGIPSPIVYPASAWQGLLAKLIKEGTATDSHTKNFKRFFSAKYAVENEEGDLVTPAPRKLAPLALEDSNLPKIEESVIQTVVQNSGWNLLSDALSKLDKAAKAIEDNLNAQISGWEMEFEALKQKVEEYKNQTDLVNNKVGSVKKSVERQKQRLIKDFSEGVEQFTDKAKEKIEEEILKISQSYSPKTTKKKKSAQIVDAQAIPFKEKNFGITIPNWIPVFGGFSFNFESKNPLLETMREAIPNLFNESNSEEYQSSDSYKIKVKTKNEGETIVQTINDYCSSHLKNWWVDTQDKLTNEGTEIREKLVTKIQEDIQAISNELSNHLGETLNIQLNINQIQFPSFNFSGIDAKIKQQQEVYLTKEQVTRHDYSQSKGFCENDQHYHSRIAYTDYQDVQNTREFYEIDLLQIVHEIKQKIDSQAFGTQKLIQRVIEKQIKEDFKNAEQQINDYIDRFQTMFDNLIQEREIKAGQREEICTALEAQKIQLNVYLHQLSSIRESLDSWKPVNHSK